MVDVHSPESSITGKVHSLSISDPGRFIYVHNAKVGTRSVLGAFAGRPDLELVTRKGRLRRWPAGPRRDYTAFAFVRNPFTRVVSCWQDKVVGGGRWPLAHLAGLGFEEFLTELEAMDLAHSDRHVRPQTDLVPLERLAFLGRLEQMQRDWERVCEVLGLGELALPQRNVSTVPLEQVRLTEAIADRIRRLYAADFALLGYSTEVPERLR